MESTTRLCIVCGGPEQPRNPLCADFDHEVLMHLQCYNSEGAEKWRKQRCEADPVYARHLKLMSVREPIKCPHCSAMLDLSPKAVGMGAGSWTVNCTQCHRISRGCFSGYGPSAQGYAKLESIRGDFVRSRNLNEIDARVLRLARGFDPYINGRPCACGERFSIAAKPRCPRCDHVVLDSYFHVVDEPLSEERLKRLDSLFRQER